MPSRRAPHAIIFLTVFLDLVGFGIVIPVLPLYAQRFGASPLVIGCLLAVYSLMQAICAPLLGRLSDRVGRRPVLLVSLLGTAAGFVLMGLANSLPLLFLGRIIDGITGGNISTAQAYIADITPPQERSRRMGLIGAAFGIGFIFGPAIGGLLSHVSAAAPFLFAGALALANALAVFVLLPESLPPERRGVAHERQSVFSVLREAGSRPLTTILLTYFCTTVAFSLMTATYPLFTQHRFGYSVSQIGYIFAGLGIVGALVQGVLLGRLLKLTNDRLLTIAGTAMLTVGLFTLPLPASAAAMLAATVAIGVGHGLVAAPLNGLASRSVGESAQGRVLGLMQSAASMARIVGPVLGGWLLNHDVMAAGTVYGLSPYWAGGVIMALACAIASTL